MVHVTGEYCPALEHECLRWLDPDKAIVRRCAEYKRKSQCRSRDTVQLNFCIDRNEFTKVGEQLPTSDVSWRQAKALCEERGKRLCTEHEWTLACEGPQRLPYPYGWERDATRCNIDRQDLLSRGELKDHRKPAADFPGCLSPYGVHNLTGNVGEWVQIETAPPPFRSGGKGGWWGPLRNRCRAVTTGHNEFFHQIQIGFRCCKS